MKGHVIRVNHGLERLGLVYTNHTIFLLSLETSRQWRQWRTLASQVTHRSPSAWSAVPMNRAKFLCSFVSRRESPLERYLPITEKITPELVVVF